MAASGKTEEAAGRAVLEADGAVRAEAVQFLERCGYEVMERARAGEEPDVVVVILADSSVAIPKYGSDTECPPPVLVFGPQGGDWRRRALEEGAFACLSWEAPLEERVSLVGAAGRYRAVQRELDLVRRESDTVVSRLLVSYGEEAQRLRGAIRERREIQEALDRIRMRIIRSIL